MEHITMKLAEDSPVGRAGEIVTLALTPSDVHDPSELPTYLAGYRPFPFRAEDVLKPVPVQNQTFKQRQFGSDDAFKRVNVKASQQAPHPEVDSESSLVEQRAVERVIGSFISAQTEAEAMYAVRQRGAKRCGWALGLDMECDTWDLLTNTAKWASATFYTTLAADQKWNGGENSDPLGVIQDAMLASYQPVTDVWFNQRVAFAFLDHPKVADKMRQLLGDNAAPQAIANVQSANKKMVDFEIPGYPTFHVVASKVKSDSTGVVDFCLGDHTLLTTTPAGMPTDGEEMATGYIYRVRGPVGVGFETREYRVENRGGKGGTMVVCYAFDVPLFAGNNCGGLVKSCYQ
jgi:hypothetical protein